jgi:hypothetical protein
MPFRRRSLGRVGMIPIGMFMFVVMMMSVGVIIMAVIVFMMGMVVLMGV